MNKLTGIQTHSINQLIKLNNKLSIIRLDVTEKDNYKSEDNKNIYCVHSDTNEILWQVECEQTGFSKDPFVNIKLENGELFARNFSGFKYKIDLKNGLAKRIGWSK